MLIGMMCSRERHHGHQEQNDEGEEGDEHDEADHASRSTRSSRSSRPPTLPEAIAEFYERELGLNAVRDPHHAVRDPHHAVRDPHHAVREQHVHGNPPQHDRMVNFPDLRYCPGHGQVYHVPQCGCLKSGKRIARYTADDHERLHLAACGQCQPTVLPGSGAPIVRRRRTRR